MPTINYNAALPAFSSISGRSSIDINKWVSELKFNISSLIKSLFANNEQGFFYDPNDLSTMYQDAAGTVPVTAVGQPVGLIRDKSGRNNHAYQTVSASRPTLSSRVNLLTGTDKLTSWSIVNIDKVDNTLKAVGGTPVHHICHKTFTYVPSSMITYYAEVTKGSGFCFFQLCYSNTNRFKCTINLATGEHAVKKLLTNTTTVVVEDGGDVWKLTLTGSASGTSGSAYANMGFATSLSDDTCNTYDEPVFLASGSESMTIKAIDVRETHIGSNLPKYQRVTSPTDYDSVGFPNYLVFDGVDDFLQTNNIDFTATDKVSLFAGVRKLSDATAGVLCELSTSVAVSNSNGVFAVLAPGTTTLTTFRPYSKGTVLANTNAVPTAPAPNSFVGTAKMSISMPKIDVRVDGVDRVFTNEDQGTGNYGNYPLYIGRRGGTSLPFNGHIYGLIGIGKLTSDSETTAIEKELAKRTGVTLNV